MKHSLRCTHITSILFTLASVISTLAHAKNQHHVNEYAKRDNQGDVISLSRSNPVQAAKLVQQFPGLAGNATANADNSLAIVKGDSDSAQLPWNVNVTFFATPDTNISTALGWEMIPNLEGFYTNRTWEVVPGAIMPFYIKSGIEASAIKRALITWPGKPRDSWKYANLFRNALNVVETNSSYGIANNTILIISPIFLNELDQQAGSVQAKELYFKGSNWQAGGSSIGPTLKQKLSTYQVLDNFTDMLFNKELYPNLNQVVIAGHSMGGQATHRYALLKKQKFYDDNMSYWVGNPGSWTWLSSDRPYHNSSCSSVYDDWHYGIGGNISKVTKYARDDVKANKTAVVQRYLNRKVHMALGLLDYGAGDTHCQAGDQGGSHLDRGSNMVIHLANINKGTFPTAQTVDFIANTSHQDFAMISTNVSLEWLFVNDYNQRYPDINATNPGDDYNKSIKVTKGHIATTHGDKILGASMFGGSLFSVLMFFIILPFLFPANWKEEEEDGRVYPPTNHYDPNISTPWSAHSGLLNLQMMQPRRDSVPQSKTSLAPTYTSYI